MKEGSDTCQPQGCRPLFLCLCVSLCLCLSLVVGRSGTVTGWCGRYLDQVHLRVLQAHHPGRGQLQHKVGDGPDRLIPRRLRTAADPTSAASGGHRGPDCTHFPRLSPQVGVLRHRQRNSSALQMALQMRPWGFHLADTLCPGPGFLPQRRPPAPAGQLHLPSPPTPKP